MPREYNLISADSHILEPPHLWTTYMPSKFHHKVPRVVPDGEGGEAWQFAADVPPAPIGIYASAGRKHEDVRWTGVTFAEAETVFLDEEALLIADPEHSDNEGRFVLLGLSARLRTLVVCHCYRERDSIIRIISARKADRQERARYEQRRRR